jgi:vacuole membrane protein 1
MTDDVCTQKHGFMGVLLMAAWPNMAFDMCGIACGHFLMPFATFFSAVVVGKALIKVNMQALFFITVFGRSYLEALVAFVARIEAATYVGGGG